MGSWKIEGNIFLSRSNHYSRSYATYSHDGITKFLLKLEDAYQSLLIKKSTKKVNGLLVVEVIPADKDSSKIEIREMVRVRVVGPRVTDEDR